MSDSKKNVDLLKVAPGEETKRAEVSLDGTASGEPRVFPDAFAARGNVTAAPAILVAQDEE